MRILFTCGGTGGHINPAISTADYIKARRPETEILFAGNPDGMEARLVTQAGYRFEPIRVKGLQRRFTLRNIKNNALALVYLTSAPRRAKAILNDFQPDLVMGTGGYVSLPVMAAAAKMGFRTVTHEQNAFPGLVTKYLAQRVDKVLLAFEEALKFLPEGIDYTITGNPVREQFLFADREKIRREMGIGDRICILSYGGSQGAKYLNLAIADFIGLYRGKRDFYHIHATGSFGKEWFPELLRKRGIVPRREEGLDVREYLDNMPECMAAADLVICRAGAITLCELETAGKASVLIPSPNVAENHQFHNAMVLVNHNAAMVLEEKDLSGQALFDTVERLTSDPAVLRQFAQNAQSLAILDTNQRIYEEILRLLEK